MEQEAEHMSTFGTHVSYTWNGPCGPHGGGVVLPASKLGACMPRRKEKEGKNRERERKSATKIKEEKEKQEEEEEEERKKYESRDRAKTFSILSNPFSEPLSFCNLHTLRKIHNRLI